MRPNRLLPCAALVAALLAPPAASASFPGANGGLAITEDNCASVMDRHIQSYGQLGSRRAELTPSCDRFSSGVARSTYGPDFSPDGKRLLYVDGGGDGEQAHYEVAAADGSAPQPILGPVPTTGAPGVDPSFAPDGRRFTYVEGVNRIMIASVDGGAPTVLRGLPNVLSAHWSPRGDLIAITRGGGFTTDGVWVVSASTGRIVRRLSRRLPVDLDWSPDGRRIVFSSEYFHSEITGKAKGGNLFVTRVDGRERPRRVVRTRDVAAVSPVWSPDARSLMWVELGFSAGDVAFDVSATLWRMSFREGRRRRLDPLPSPRVEEAFHSVPDLAWQPRPAR